MYTLVPSTQPAKLNRPSSLIPQKVEKIVEKEKIVRPRRSWRSEDLTVDNREEIEALQKKMRLACCTDEDRLELEARRG